MATQIVPAPEHHLEDFATRIKPRTASNLLLWGIGVFFVAAALWATFTRIDRTVHATGKIVPSSRLQVISNLEGGIVSAILVRAGDLVRAGQELVRMDQTATGAELSSGEIQASNLAVKIARLEAEISGRQPVYPNPTGNAAVAEQIAIERSLYASRVSDLASASAAASARVQQARRAVAEAEAALQSRQSAKRSYEQQIAMIRPLVDRGIEPRLNLIQLESQLAVATSDQAGAAAAISRAQASVSEATSALAQLRQNWRAQAATELTAAQAEFAARRNALPALADKVRRTSVKAPMAGRINRVSVSTVGGVIGAGQPLVELVPSEDTLVVEGMVLPKDIASVRIGQSARINVSAYDSAIYGSMFGEVMTISPDATTDERTGESHYTVKVRTTGEMLKGANGKPLPIGPGMQVDVSLLGDKRSILSYLFSPITRLSERAMRE